MTKPTHLFDDPSKPGDFTRLSRAGEYCRRCQAVTDHDTTLTFVNGVQRSHQSLCVCGYVTWRSTFSTEHPSYDYSRDAKEATAPRGQMSLW